MSDLQHVKGLNDLSRKLAALGKDMAGKTLRQSAMNATTPALKALKAAAPRGKSLHKTYKGRTVAPGFLSRSVARKSSYKNGRARVEIGVKKEAFYGVLFVEQGTKPHDIPKKGKLYQHFVPRRNGRGVRITRRSSVSGAWRKKALAFGGSVVKSVKHPGAKANPWFTRTFEKSRKKMVSRFSDQLQAKIERLAKK